MPIVGEVVAQELGNGKEGADGPYARCVERGPEAGADVLRIGGAGEADFWRVKGVGVGECSSAGWGVEGFKKLKGSAASNDFKKLRLAVFYCK